MIKKNYDIILDYFKNGWSTWSETKCSERLFYWWDQRKRMNEQRA